MLLGREPVGQPDVVDRGNPVRRQDDVAPRGDKHAHRAAAMTAQHCRCIAMAISDGLPKGATLRGIAQSGKRSSTRQPGKA